MTVHDRQGKPARSTGRVSEYPARVVIECVGPRLDDGRYPIKRIIGDVCEVGADIYKDGHDRLGARVLVREPGVRPWAYFPLHYDYNGDRWSGSFPLHRIGRWEFTVEAWTDVFGTWESELEKKVEAGLDVRTELAEGGALVRDAMGRAAGVTKARLRRWAEILENPAISAEQRIEAAEDPELRAIMAEHFDPALVTRYDRVLEITVDRERARHGAWYELFPRSQGDAGEHGTFRDAERGLPRLADLGFDVIYLPPIHPIGVTNRKGRNNSLVAEPGDPGSPWAIGNEHGGHTAVEPRLGTLQDFERYVKRARDLGMEVALDYALQCSPDHPWVREHPEWFNVRPDGSIKYAENPPKKYEDIYPLNFWCEDYERLWQACKEIFLHWMECGVRIFRVDNPHTKPFAFWEWVISDIQSTDPDVIFLSEAFTRPKRMKGLAKLGFTQSYTYFTWRNTPAELQAYLAELAHGPTAEYLRPNFFANTPDILTEYLQHGGRPAFRARLLLASTLSPSYGIYSGFELCENTPRQPGGEEYLNSEKYEIKHRKFGGPEDISDEIAQVNRIRRENPALQTLTNVTFHHSENDRVLFFRRYAPDNELLVAVNTDPHQTHESTLHVPIAELGIAADEPYVLEDLLSGDRYEWTGEKNYIRLDPEKQPGHILRVSTDGSRAR